MEINFDAWFEESRERFNFIKPLSKEDLQMAFNAGFEAGWEQCEEEFSPSITAVIARFEEIRKEWNLDEGIQELPDYHKSYYKRFVIEIYDNDDLREGLEDYHGRYGYQGPAVRIDTDDLQKVIRTTSMPLQWDQMGKDGLIVYPK